MNYLAHAYLSFDDPEVLAGNMISDFVKGKRKFDYPPRILAGIDLHRAIDAFTDAHPLAKASSSFFHAHYRLYSAAFVDVVYDHFLAIQLAERGQDWFLAYTKHVYAMLQSVGHLFPARFAGMLPYMIRDNWLYHYQYDNGIRNSFAGLVHRAAYLSDSETAFRLFKKHYDQLKAHFEVFFPELLNFSLDKFAEIH